MLDDRYHGTTKAYTHGQRRLRREVGQQPVTTSVKAHNLGNQAIQQHVFGDIIKRPVVGELRVNF